MRVGSNIAALNAAHGFARTQDKLSTALERLSSGLRVNRASDDAGGLAVSEALRAKVRGTQMARRNTQDGLALINTAEGAAGEIHTMLQRMREIAVRAANGTYTDTQRTAMQAEITQIIAEIDRLAAATDFNDIDVLSSGVSAADYTAVQNALMTSMLYDGYQTALSAYGITHAPSPSLNIFLDGGGGSFAAFVSSNLAPTFSPTLLELHINMEYFAPNVAAGNIDQLEVTIAHEFVHALMDDETNMSAFPDWFQEGTADFAPGRDDRVASALASLGGDTPANRQALINLVSNTSWGGGTNDYAGAYIATKYLHDQLIAAGVPGGMADAFQGTLDDQLNDLNDVVALAGYADQDAFVADFQANGLAWMNANMNLADADLGGIGGADYGGPVRDFTTRVTTSGFGGDPTPWNEVWEPNDSLPIDIQVGADQGDVITLTTIDGSSSGLGVSNVSVVTIGAARTAITTLDGAIQTLSEARATLGAQANRLEHTLDTIDANIESQAGAESRIRDADMAAEHTALTRSQILAQSGVAMVAAANARPQSVLALLRAAS